MESPPCGTASAYRSADRVGTRCASPQMPKLPIHDLRPASTALASPAAENTAGRTMLPHVSANRPWTVTGWPIPV